MTVFHMVLLWSLLKQILDVKLLKTVLSALLASNFHGMVCESILSLSLALRHLGVETRVHVCCIIPSFLFLSERFCLGAWFGFLSNSLYQNENLYYCSR